MPWVKTVPFIWVGHTHGWVGHTHTVWVLITDIKAKKINEKNWQLHALSHLRAKFCHFRVYYKSVERYNQIKQQQVCQTFLWGSVMSKRFTLIIWSSCCFAFFKGNWSWIEMSPSLFRSDLLRNPEFAVNCYVFKDRWSNLHSNLFAFPLDQHSISKPSARPHHLSNFRHNSSIGPTPLSLHGAHSESVGSCLWLNPRLLLMGVRCHCGGIKADLWAWHWVRVTNPSESVAGKDGGQIWG